MAQSGGQQGERSLSNVHLRFEHGKGQTNDEEEGMKESTCATSEGVEKCSHEATKVDKGRMHSIGSAMCKSSDIGTTVGHCEKGTVKMQKRMARSARSVAPVFLPLRASGTLWGTRHDQERKMKTKARKSNFIQKLNEHEAQHLNSSVESILSGRDVVKFEPSSKALMTYTGTGKKELQESRPLVKTTSQIVPFHQLHSTKREKPGKLQTMQLNEKNKTMDQNNEANIDKSEKAYASDTDGSIVKVATGAHVHNVKATESFGTRLEIKQCSSTDYSLWDPTIISGQDQCDAQHVNQECYNTENNCDKKKPQKVCLSGEKIRTERGKKQRGGNIEDTKAQKILPRSRSQRASAEKCNQFVRALHSASSVFSRQKQGMGESERRTITNKRKAAFVQRLHERIENHGETAENAALLSGRDIVKYESSPRALMEYDENKQSYFAEPPPLPSDQQIVIYDPTTLLYPSLQRKNISNPEYENHSIEKRIGGSNRACANGANSSKHGESATSTSLDSLSKCEKSLARTVSDEGVNSNIEMKKKLSQCASSAQMNAVAIVGKNPSSGHESQRCTAQEQVVSTLSTGANGPSVQDDSTKQSENCPARECSPLVTTDSVFRELNDHSQGQTRSCPRDSAAGKEMKLHGNDIKATDHQEAENNECSKRTCTKRSHTCSYSQIESQQAKKSTSQEERKRNSMRSKRRVSQKKECQGSVDCSDSHDKDCLHKGFNAIDILRDSKSKPKSMHGKNVVGQVAQTKTVSSVGNAYKRKQPQKTCCRRTKKTRSQTGSRRHSASTTTSKSEVSREARKWMGRKEKQVRPDTSARNKVVTNSAQGEQNILPSRKSEECNKKENEYIVGAIDKCRQINITARVPIDPSVGDAQATEHQEPASCGVSDYRESRISQNRSKMIYAQEETARIHEEAKITKRTKSRSPRSDEDERINTLTDGSSCAQLEFSHHFQIEDRNLRAVDSDGTCNHVSSDALEQEETPTVAEASSVRGSPKVDDAKAIEHHSTGTLEGCRKRGKTLFEPSVRTQHTSGQAHYRERKIEGDQSTADTKGQQIRSMSKASLFPPRDTNLPLQNESCERNSYKMTVDTKNACEDKSQDKELDKRKHLIRQVDRTKEESVDSTRKTDKRKKETCIATRKQDQTEAREEKKSKSTKLGRRRREKKRNRKDIAEQQDKKEHVLQGGGLNSQVGSSPSAQNDPCRCDVSESPVIVNLSKDLDNANLTKDNRNGDKKDAILGGELAEKNIAGKCLTVERRDKQLVAQSRIHGVHTLSVVHINQSKTSESARRRKRRKQLAQGERTAHPTAGGLNDVIKSQSVIGRGPLQSRTRIISRAAKARVSNWLKKTKKMAQRKTSRESTQEAIKQDSRGWPRLRYRHRRLRRISLSSIPEEPDLAIKDKPSEESSVNTSLPSLNVCPKASFKESSSGEADTKSLQCNSAAENTAVVLRGSSDMEADVGNSNEQNPLPDPDQSSDCEFHLCDDFFWETCWSIYTSLRFYHTSIPQVELTRVDPNRRMTNYIVPRTTIASTKRSLFN